MRTFGPSQWRESDQELRDCFAAMPNIKSEELSNLDEINNRLDFFHIIVLFGVPAEESTLSR